MIVCIAEKPGVARDIAKILGANVSHQGYMEGNGFQVTWTYGHLCELKQPEEYNPGWKYWALGQLPMIPPRFGIRLKDDAGVRKQFAVIERLMSCADRIVNCGDAGQEGELIQRWVMQKAGAKCPVDRLWISSLTEESIREGFACLKSQEKYDSLYAAGLCRAIGDWLLGMNATRLYTLKYGGARSKGQPPLSVGRVQTPTLALIVKRQEEIDRFKPEPYWVLTTVYRDVVFKSASEEKDEAALRELLEKIAAVPFRVREVEKKQGVEAPERLFDLTSLQVECNKRFAFSAEQTLSLIQSLYEKKLTTYPRVDTTYLSDDIYPKCRGILNGISGKYGELLQPLRGSVLRKRSKVFNSAKVTDHHAIIPTGIAPTGISDMELKVYDLVARRFISVFYADCKFLSTEVTGTADDVVFKARGKQIVEEGWRAVAPSAFQGGTPSEVSGEDGGVESREESVERLLPAFQVGEEGPHRPELTQKETQPPRPYTEATLLRAMETAGRMVEDESLREVLKENGIGRPSTRAAIIETLFKRNYIVRRRKNLYPTVTGTELIGLIREELLKSAELTGIWERKLRQIERKEYEPARFVDELKQMVSNLVLEVLGDNRARVVPQAPSSAPSPAREGTRADSKPTKGSSKEPSPRAAGTKDGRPSVSRKIVRAGSPCPKCGVGKVVKGHTAYGCSRWREGCDWRKPFK